jgi:hypothetical protein
MVLSSNNSNSKTTKDELSILEALSKVSSDEKNKIEELIKKSKEILEERKKSQEEKDENIFANIMKSTTLSEIKKFSVDNLKKFCDSKKIQINTVNGKKILKEDYVNVIHTYLSKNNISIEQNITENQDECEKEEHVELTESEIEKLTEIFPVLNVQDEMLELIDLNVDQLLSKCNYLKIDISSKYKYSKFQLIKKLLESKLIKNRSKEIENQILNIIGKPFQFWNTNREEEYPIFQQSYRDVFNAVDEVGVRNL